MLNNLSHPTEMHPPSAQEFALRARQIENQPAGMPAEISLSDHQHSIRKKGLVDLIVTLFGGPTLF